MEIESGGFVVERSTVDRSFHYKANPGEFRENALKLYHIVVDWSKAFKWILRQTVVVGSLWREKEC